MPRAIALTTNKNNPKVRIVRGRVNKIKIGLTIAFTKPKTIAPTAAAVIPAIVKPGTIQAVINSEIALASQVSKN